MLMNGRSGPFHFGDFRVYDRVETGRLAGMFRAGNLKSGQPAILYFIAGAPAQDPARWQALADTARSVIEIKHPHVSRLEELVSADGYKFMVLESLDGKSLVELADGKPMKPEDVCRYLRKAAAGLDRLHKLGRAHGDVRPDNLFVDSSGQLKLLYFPIASDPFAAPGSDPRNADFLAPECAAPHHRPPDARSDIYALGATTYALLAGRPPFQGADALDKARRHASEPLAPLEQVAKTPAALGRLVAVMMAKNPQGRPGSVMEVASALQSIVERKTKAAAAVTNGAVPAVATAPAPPAASVMQGAPTAVSPPSPSAAAPVAPAPPPAHGWSMPPSQPVAPSPYPIMAQPGIAHAAMAHPAHMPPSSGSWSAACPAAELRSGLCAGGGRARNGPFALAGPRPACNARRGASARGICSWRRSGGGWPWRGVGRSAGDGRPGGERPAQERARAFLCPTGCAARCRAAFAGGQALGAQGEGQDQRIRSAHDRRRGRGRGVHHWRRGCVLNNERREKRATRAVE